MFYFTFSDPQNLRVTVNHSLSEDKCNQQCIGGCNGTSHLNCFACRRVMDQLSDGRKNCIEQCPDGLLLVRKFCCLLVFLSVNKIYNTRVPSLYTFLDRPSSSLPVLEQIWLKGSSLDQRLLQHESLNPIGLRSEGIEIPHKWVPLHIFFKN